MEIRDLIFCVLLRSCLFISLAVAILIFHLYYLLLTTCIDDTTYDTVFQTTQGDTLIVRVHVPLSSSFTSLCPAMSLAGVRVRHDWVEERSMRITGYDPIQTEHMWKRSGLSLGQAVHEVVQHLQLNPPEILEITDAGLQSIQPKNSRFKAKDSNHNSSSTHTSTNSNIDNGSSHRQNAEPPSYDATLQNAKRAPKLPPAPDVPLPPIPRDFDSILAEKTKEQLESLLSDELEFLSLVQDLDVFGEIRMITTSETDENHRLAHQNIANVEKLKSLREEVEKLQKILKTKVERFQSLEQQLNSLSAPLDVKSIMRKLKDAKKQAFETSEVFAEEWIEDGAPNVDEFMKEFMERRKVHHERAGKMEILQQLSQSIR